MEKREKTGAILSALFVIVYYAAIPLIFAGQPDIPLWGKLLLAVLPLALAGVMAAVLVRRLRELKSGEIRDLDQY